MSDLLTPYVLDQLKHILIRRIDEAINALTHVALDPSDKLLECIQQAEAER